MAIKKLTEIERAYLAGFFDGEGCVASRKEDSRSKAGAHIQISMSQKNPEVLIYLQGLTNIGSLKAEKDGTWRWVISNKTDIKSFIKLIYPYSIEKKEQLKLGYWLASLLGRTTKRVSGSHRGATEILEDRVTMRNRLHVQIQELKHA